MTSAHSSTSRRVCPIGPLTAVERKYSGGWTGGHLGVGIQSKLGVSRRRPGWPPEIPDWAQWPRSARGWPFGLRRDIWARGASASQPLLEPPR
eukprot:scaffold2140_cov394-Prasinococcus_capsulatus_cf.AAC.12